VRGRKLGTLNHERQGPMPATRLRLTVGVVNAAQEEAWRKLWHRLLEPSEGSRQAEACLTVKGGRRKAVTGEEDTLE
jgi:hypothetical protein